MSHITSICEATKDSFAVFETERSNAEARHYSYARVAVWAAFEDHVAPMILGPNGVLEPVSTGNRKLKGLFENIGAAQNHIQNLGAGRITQ